MDFVATQEFETPYVIATGQPHRPTQICKKKFKKGEIITGEIKTAKGKPSFVLHKGVMLIPLSCVKQVITRDITVGADSAVSDNTIKANPKVEVRTIKTSDQKNKDYFGGVLIGGALGLAGAILAEKQEWIPAEKKNKMYGIIAGALIGIYFIYKKNK